eukprot:808722-Pyramimonas_sp.AAC.1
MWRADAEALKKKVTERLIKKRHCGGGSDGVDVAVDALVESEAGAAAGGAGGAGAKPDQPSGPSEAGIEPEMTKIRAASAAVTSTFRGRHFRGGGFSTSSESPDEGAFLA